MSRYPNAEIVWCQEGKFGAWKPFSSFLEPKNQGAWSYLYFFLKTTLKSLHDSRKVKYVGRQPSASPATGSHHIHKKEQKELLNAAFGQFE
jgi:2-oxoglutarate dehydrogenase E1 component